MDLAESEVKEFKPLLPKRQDKMVSLNQFYFSHRGQSYLHHAQSLPVTEVIILVSGNSQPWIVFQYVNISCQSQEIKQQIKFLHLEPHPLLKWDGVMCCVPSKLYACGIVHCSVVDSQHTRKYAAPKTQFFIYFFIIGVSFVLQLKKQ